MRFVQSDMCLPSTTAPFASGPVRADEFIEILATTDLRWWRIFNLYSTVAAITRSQIMSLFMVGITLPVSPTILHVLGGLCPGD